MHLLEKHKPASCYRILYLGPRPIKRGHHYRQPKNTRDSSKTKKTNFPVTPNLQYFLKSTAVQMGDVLPYKWEAYCNTNGGCIVGFPFLQGLEARKVQRYKWGAYCRTNWRCTAVLSLRAVGVGVSETLRSQGRKSHNSDSLYLWDFPP